MTKSTSEEKHVTKIYLSFSHIKISIFLLSALEYKICSATFYML